MSKVAIVKDELAKLEATRDTTDAEIEKLVYDLYNLTEDEIAIVEGSAG
ncbi:hypothetical protein KAH81_05260 [bacterium]|nr:hypothetical protein [bacterium]